jgi:hypothetical protein
MAEFLLDTEAARRQQHRFLNLPLNRIRRGIIP